MTPPPGMTYPNRTTAPFVCNGDSLRIKVREPDAAEEDYFLYDGVRPYMRMESAQGLPRAVYVSEGGTYYSPIVTLRTANANWTYLREPPSPKWLRLRRLNGMESVRKILNESQTTTDAYSYEAFGNPMGQAGTTVNPFRYVGALGYYWFDFAHHGRDRTSGLRLLGARYYGPSPRRFWTQDPLGEGVNWYAYVGSDPTNSADPDGMSTRAPAGEPDDVKRIRRCLQKCGPKRPQDLSKCFLSCLGKGFTQDLCVKYGCHIFQCPSYGNPCDPKNKYPGERAQCQDCADLKRSCCGLFNPTPLGQHMCNKNFERACLQCPRQ